MSILEKVSDVRTVKTCRGNVDYRIPGKPHATVQKEGTNCKKTVKKKLIQQFENHPNWESLIKDLNRTEEFNPFSEELKELNHGYGQYGNIRTLRDFF